MSSTCERRLFLRNGLSLGALTLLTGCDVVTNTGPVDRFLRMISRLQRRRAGRAVQSATGWRRPFPRAWCRPQFRFNAQYGIDKIPMLNPATWRLQPSGPRRATSRPWTLEQLQALPQRADVTRHVCVEGWSMIGKWGGVPLRTFLEQVGADLSAQLRQRSTATTRSATTTSIDMASALHPQTILCLTYAGKPHRAAVRRADAREDPDQARLQAAEVRDRDPGDERRIRPATGRTTATTGLPGSDIPGRKFPAEALSGNGWSERGDLNSRPPVPQASANATTT